MITLICKDRKIQLRDGSTFEDAAKQFADCYDSRILLAHTQEDNHVIELFKPIEENYTVEFLTYKDEYGFRAYSRTAVMMFFKAVYELYGIEAAENTKVEFNFGGNMYIRPYGRKADKELAEVIKKRMLEYAEADIPVERSNYPVYKAISYLNASGRERMARMLRYRIPATINYYIMDGCRAYFYDSLAPSAGYVDLFDLIPYGNGLLLVLPDRKDPSKLSTVPEASRLFKVQSESQQWAVDLGIENLSDLNHYVSLGRTDDLVLMQEAMFEKKLGDVAQRIVAKQKKIVLLAGPSSSGKTTTAYRLAIQLRALGVAPTIVSADNYFVDIDHRVLDENGQPDFESVKAVDTVKFNEDMLDYLAGKTVEMPSFNFVTQKREYKGARLVPADNAVLIIEGIHCLNPVFSEKLPEESKFRLYVSALTPLSVNEQNPIPTSDIRLLRRIVRDNATRGYTAADTISRWKSVRDGEEINIFPYQENADMVINSAMIYEPSVIKLFVDPLLFSISPDDPSYPEARRLLKFLDFVLPLSPEIIPRTSVLREFIGGSCIDIG